MQTEKFLVVIEIPMEFEIEDVREAIEESTGYIVKETELKNKLRWLLVNPYEE